MRRLRRSELLFLVSFLVIAALTLGVMDRFASASMDVWKAPEWSGKVAHFQSRYRNASPEEVLVGDSTVSVGVRPDKAGWAAFNMGRSALIPLELDRLTERLDELGVRPRTLYMSINPMMLFNPQWELNGRVIPFKDKARFALSSFYSDPNSFGSAFLPGHVLIRGLVGQAKISITGKASFYIDSDGAEIQHLSEHKQAMNLAVSLDETLGFSPQVHDPEYVTGVVGNLRRFKKTWNDRGVRVVWVLMPTHPDFQRRLEADPHRSYQVYMDVLRQVFGAGEVVDCRGTMEGDAFYDFTHLRPEAAELFTHKLKAAVHPAPAAAERG